MNHQPNTFPFPDDSSTAASSPFSSLLSSLHRQTHLRLYIRCYRVFNKAFRDRKKLETWETTGRTRAQKTGSVPELSSKSGLNFLIGVFSLPDKILRSKMLEKIRWRCILAANKIFYILIENDEPIKLQRQAMCKVPRLFSLWTFEWSNLLSSNCSCNFFGISWRTQ